MWKPRDCHSEWSQTEKNKYIISFICGIKKNGTNELIYKTELQMGKTNLQLLAWEKVGEE